MPEIFTHQISTKIWSKLKGATSGAGTAHPSGAPEFTLSFLYFSVQCFVDHCLFFFFWPLCCLSLDLRLIITPLVSSKLYHSGFIQFLYNTKTVSWFYCQPLLFRFFIQTIYIHCQQIQNLFVRASSQNQLKKVSNWQIILSCFLHFNTSCLVEKQQIPISQSLV